MPLLARSLALLSLAAALAASAALAAEPVLSDFPPEKDACFGRIDDGVHLAAHPRQTVRELYLMRSLEADPETEALPLPPSEVATQYAEIEAESRRHGGARTTLEILAGLRGQKDMLKQGLDCWPDGMGRFHCGVDCDGGGFEAQKEGQALKLRIANTGGLRVQSGCSSGDESAPEVRIGGDRDGDDLSFRLEPLPPAACLRARDAARPPWVGKGPPLRTVFAKAKRACFVLAEDGDTAKAAGKAGLTALSLAIDAADDEEGGGMQLKVRFSGKLGTQRAAHTLECRAMDYAFYCGTEMEGGVKLYRAGAGALMAAEMTYQGGELAQLFDRPTTLKLGPFRLVAEPLENCAR